MNKFDRGRNMGDVSNEEQMTEIIKMQEGAINQLKEQIQSLQQQQVQQQQADFQQQQLQQQHQQFQPQNFLLMKPKDIIQQFRQIRPLFNNRNINGFIKSIEMVIGLCGNNSELVKFGIQIIVNEKITADFGTYIRELGDISWEQLKAKLRIQARPRSTYAEVYNRCRYIKVSTLRELFDHFETARHQISEMYEFDDNKSLLYQSENVDRDLVNILIEKIDGPLRVHLDESLTLSDIINKYTKLGLLDDSRAIDGRHKANKNFKINQNQNNNDNYKNQIRSPQNFNQYKKKEKNYGSNQAQHFRNYNNYDNRNFNSLQPQNIKRNNDNYQSQNSFNHNNDNPSSSQTRLSHMSVDTGINSQRCHNSKYMEVDALQETEKINSDEEANFLELPRNLNYP